MGRKTYRVMLVIMTICVLMVAISKIQHKTVIISTNPLVIKEERGIDNVFFASFLAPLCVALIWEITVMYSRVNKHYKESKEELTTLTRNKLHNVRNNYNNVSYLIDNLEFDKVKDYVDRSAEYYSYTLNKWNSYTWTIADESRILEKYYCAEKIEQKNVTIIEDYDDLDIEHVWFPPEVLTTLLNNSMKHAFRDKEGECIFKITARRNKRILSFEVQDNGIASPIEKYLDVEQPNRGLNLLKRRFYNLARFTRRLRRKKDFFTVEASGNTGTAIKFKYRYETTA